MLHNIFGESIINTAINIPLQFGIIKRTTKNNGLVYDIDYKFIRDDNNVISIIELNYKPYINLSFYDNDRRKWYSVDKYNSTWRHYSRYDFILEQDGDYDISARPYTLVDGDKLNGIYYSMNNIYKNQYDYLYYSDNTTGNQNDIIKDELDIKPYSPVELSILGVNATDVTDYTYNSTYELNYITQELNKEFYVKNNKIYTNIDLTIYETKDIDIAIETTTTSLKVNCVMSANALNYSNYTPVVDYYILKLTGQHL